MRCWRSTSAARMGTRPRSVRTACSTMPRAPPRKAVALERERQRLPKPGFGSGLPRPLDRLRLCAEHQSARRVELNSNRALADRHASALLYSYSRPCPTRAIAHLRGSAHDRSALRAVLVLDERWGAAHFISRQYDDAIAALERSNEPPYWAHLYMAASHAMLGNAERARHHAAETLRLKPDFTIARAIERQPAAPRQRPRAPAGSLPQGGPAGIRRVSKRVTEHRRC